MNLVMTGAGKFIEVQATAEQIPFDDPQLGELIALAKAGILELIELQNEALSRYQ
jgi:ribonuclease PH